MLWTTLLKMGQVVNNLRTSFTVLVSSVRELIAKRIVELRESKGFSQSEFARKLGQARTTVHNWESGRNKPEDEAMLEVCRVLGTSVSYLMGQTDDPRPAPDWHKGNGPSSEAEARAKKAARLLREAAALLDAPSEETGREGQPQREAHVIEQKPTE
jgi:transcriptional regulator with XRE-family HTH domain